MAMSRDLQQFHNYVQCHEAVQLVCNKAILQCVENVIRDWHFKKQVLLHTTNQQVSLQACSSPSQCPTRVRDNKRRRHPNHCPVHPPPCQKCIEWCHAIESVYWTNGRPPKDAQVMWTNINPTKLYNDHIEFAKAFAVSLPHSQNVTSFSDFDPACLLKMMMRFGKCHHDNKTNHDKIKKVYFVRNELCHKRVADDLQLTLSERNDFFDSIFDLVDCLTQMHPGYLSQAQADDVLDQLQNMQVQTVTPEMEERASKPLTAEMKEWMQQLVEESNKELKSSIQEMTKTVQGTVLDTTTTQTSQLQDRIAQQTKEIQDSWEETASDQTRILEDPLRAQTNLQSMEVFEKTVQQTRHIQDTVAATSLSQIRRLQDTVRGQTKQHTSEIGSQISNVHTNIEARAQERHEQLQQVIMSPDTVKVTDEDVSTVTDILGPDELHHLFNNLHVPKHKVDIAEKNANTTDVILQAKSVLGWWRKKYGSAATRKVLFDARDEILRKRKEGLDQLPCKVVDIQKQNADLKLKEKIEEWKLKLKNLYLTDRREMRIGRRCFDVASIDDLYVDLEMFKYRQVGEKKLEYQEMLNLLGSDCHHMLLHGKAGTGKTTLINKIAYDWARSVEAASIHLQDAQANFEQHGPCRLPISVFDLVLVLDIHSFQSNQTLEDAIKHQLLPSASTDEINQVLNYLGSQCLIVKDGLDELSKGVKNHALGSSYLRYLSVIVTSRPHLINKFGREHKNYAQIKVLGFSKQKVSLYIEKFYRLLGKSDMASSLSKKVNVTPLLQALSIFPVLLVMICLLWEDRHKRGISFHSMTSLYTEAVSRYLNKPFEDRDEEDSLELTIEHILQSLGKTALIELFDNNIKIEGAKFENRPVLKKAIDMGLLIQSEGKLVGDTSVSFSHKTFQEYCAAVYLCHLYNSNKSRFKLYLSEIKKDNVDQMEYLLRFSCGINLPVASTIFTHVLTLVTKDLESFIQRNPWWKLPLVLFHEIELSHGRENVNKYQFHNELSSRSLGNKVDISDAESLAAFIHFSTYDHTIARETWLRKIKSLTVWCGFHNAKDLIQMLYSMPCLEFANVSLSNPLDKIMASALTQSIIQLTGGIMDSNNPPMNGTLKEFRMSGYYIRPRLMDISALVTLLHCLPSLTKLFLSQVALISGDGCSLAPLSQSLREVRIGSDFPSSSDVGSLFSLLYCIPALTSVLLHNVELSGELHNKSLMLSKSLIEFKMSGEVNLRTLLNLLHCMPALTKVLLNRIKLCGNIGENSVSLCESLKEMEVGSLDEMGGHIWCVDVSHLVSLCSCMPGLSSLTLVNMRLKGQLDDSQFCGKLGKEKEKTLHLNVVDTQTHFWWDDCFSVISLLQVLRCLQASSILVSLNNIPLIDEFRADCHNVSGESQKTWIHLGLWNCTSSVASIVSLIRNIPAVKTTVTMDKVELTEEMEGSKKPMILKARSNELILSTSSRFEVCILDVKSLVSLLILLPNLEKVILCSITLVGELDENTVIPCESLTEFAMASFRLTNSSNMNVTLLGRLLRNMSAMKKVFLKIKLTGDLAGQFQIDNDSQQGLRVVGVGELKSACIVAVTSLLELLQCMPPFAQLILGNIQLSGELDGNPVSLIESLKEFMMAVGDVSVTPLVSLLSCMPALIKVTLGNVHLTGKTDRSNVTMSESLKEFEMAGGNVKVTSLLSLLSCMPALSRVKLSNIQLTDEMGDYFVILSESLKEFVMSNGSINVISLANLLSCMPVLTKVSLHRIQLLGKLVGNSVILSESLTEFEMSGGESNVLSFVNLLRCKLSLNRDVLDDSDSITLGEPQDLRMSTSTEDLFPINVVPLVSLLGCMPCLSAVSLYDVQLTGMIDINHPVILGQSLKEFNMSTRRDKPYMVNMNGLVSLLRCIPALISVSLLNIQLVGELDNRPLILSNTIEKLQMSVCDCLGTDNSKSTCYSNAVMIAAACMSSLHKLFLVQVFEADVSTLIESIIKCSRLTTHGALPLETVCLSLNNIGNSLGKLMHSFQCMPILKVLFLYGCSLHEKQFQDLGIHLGSLKMLEEIHILKTDSRCLMCLFAPESHFPCNLTALGLVETGITDERIGQLPWTRLSKLNQLHLQNNKISCKGAVALTKSLCLDYTVLQHLDLARNSIGSQGALALTEAFRHIPALQHLNLSENGIGSDGASALARSVKHSPALEHLKLAGNNIGSDGAHALATSFKHLPLLKTLDLYKNPAIGPQGLEEIFRNLIHLSNLEKLYLWYIDLSEEVLLSFPLLSACCAKLDWASRKNVLHVVVFETDEIRLICDEVRKHQS